MNYRILAEKNSVEFSVRLFQKGSKPPARICDPWRIKKWFNKFWISVWHGDNREMTLQ